MFVSQYRCETPDFEKSLTASEKKELSKNRTLMCLTTMYVRNLSTSSAGRRLIIDCEADMLAAAKLNEDEKDDGTANTANYSLPEDEEDGESEKKPEYRPPTLFTGIIYWSIVELKPSFEISHGEGSAQISHFLRNNTAKLYPSTREDRGELVIDMLWNTFDVYYSPPHDGMDAFERDVNDGKGGAKQLAEDDPLGDTLGYTLEDVRPINR